MADRSSTSLALLRVSERVARWGVRLALPAIMLAIAGCGSSTTVTVTSASRSTPASSSASTVPGWGGATTSPVQLPLTPP